MTDQRIYLVTGATGFVGTNLCRRLLAENGEVHSFIRPGSNAWRLEDIRQNLHIHEIDLCDKSSVEERIHSIRPTIIYHLATHGAYHHQNDFSSILQCNVMGTWNLIGACENTGFELFVNTGSSSEYGKKIYARRENDSLEPDSFYAMAKSTQTFLCQYMAKKEGASLVTLRPFSVFGPYEDSSRLFPRLMMAALNDAPIEMVSPNTCRDFIYIDDLIDAYLLTDKLKKAGGQVFNVGTGVQTSLKEIVECTSDLIGRKVKASWGAMEARRWDTDVWVADISKIRRELGWTPATTVREGLKRCLDWFSRNQKYYASQ